MHTILNRYKGINFIIIFFLIVKTKTVYILEHLVNMGNKNKMFSGKPIMV